MSELFKTLTIWHVLVIIGTAFGTIIEGLVPHSFGTLIAYFKSKNNTESPSFYNASQFQLNFLPASSSAFPSILLPLFILMVQRYFNRYQIISALAFLLLALSCGFSSVVNIWPILFITYSVIYSIGASLFLSVVIIVAAEYFPREHRFHVLATSLYQIGYPMAALLGNPILAYLLSRYGWQNSFKIVAVTQILLGFILSCMMKPIDSKGLFYIKTIEVDDSEKNEESLKNNESIHSGFHINIKSNYQIFPWLFGKYINYMCWYALRTNIVTYLVKSTTFGLSNSATLMSVYAASEIFVALMASLFGDYFRGWLVHIHILSAISLAILTAIYTVVLTSYLSAIFLMMAIGVSIQLSLSFGYPAAAEVWDSKSDMKIGWVLTNVAAGFGIISSPLISGILMDRIGMKSLLYAQCTGWILQAIMFAVTLVCMKYKRIETEYQNIE